MLEGGSSSGITDGVHRLARLELDLELTRHVLALHTARDAAGGRWPAALPASADSRACPGDRWLYERPDDRSVEVRLSREPRWPESRGLVLPLRWRAVAAADRESGEPRI